jgi:hypothetical protein
MTTVDKKNISKNSQRKVFFEIFPSCRNAWFVVFGSQVKTKSKHGRNNRILSSLPPEQAVFTNLSVQQLNCATDLFGFRRPGSLISLFTDFALFFNKIFF